MNLATVDKKLREARFFLSKMCETESLAFGDKEPFDFYLSAFLNASRTVDYRLRHEQGTLYRSWLATWNTALTPAETRLIQFLIADRNVEVHQSGSGRGVKTEEILVGDKYSDASGTVTVSAPPGTPPAVIRKPSYDFTIDGVDRKATDACAEYLTLLGRMVAKFTADNP